VNYGYLPFGPTGGTRRVTPRPRFSKPENRANVPGFAELSSYAAKENLAVEQQDKKFCGLRREQTGTDASSEITEHVSSVASWHSGTLASKAIRYFPGLDRIAQLLPFSRLVALTLSLTTMNAAAEPSKTDWAKIARQDMKFAIEAVRDHHAGAVAGESSVTVPLALGSGLGMIEAAKVRTEQDYLRMMMRFVSAFGDPHVEIDLHMAVRGWTGVVLDNMDGRYQVIWSEPNWPTALPPAGSGVQMCGDVWIGTYLQTQVAPFTDHSAEYASTSSHLARKVMFDLGLGWTPAQCVFTLPDGSRKRFALTLQSVSKERLHAVQRRYQAQAKPIGITKLGSDSHWVGMPDFDGKTSAAAYETLYRQLETLPKSGWLIFDLRGNGGGDSTWGNRALQALFGAEYAERLSDAGGLEKYMIASQATVAQLKYYISTPVFEAAKAESESDLAKVEAAIRAGDKMAKVGGEARVDLLAASSSPRPHGPRIAAVIDRECFSSCMNFLQQLKAIDDTVVLGESTIGYSPFGEITRFDLPSGRGALYLPSALFRTTQATREPFVPDIPFTGNMADDNALMRWVNSTLSRLTPL
jgi:hypothetical protein